MRLRDDETALIAGFPPAYSQSALEAGMVMLVHGKAPTIEQQLPEHRQFESCSGPEVSINKGLQDNVISDEANRADIYQREVPVRAKLLSARRRLPTSCMR